MDNIPVSNRTPSNWTVGPAVQEAVDKYIAENPARHRLAQQFGDFIVDHPQFSNLDTFKIIQQDISGDEIRYKEIIKMMTYHGVKPIDLEQEELIILQNKLGKEWKNILITEHNLNIEDFP